MKGCYCSNIMFHISHQIRNICHYLKSEPYQKCHYNVKADQWLYYVINYDSAEQYCCHKTICNGYIF